MLEKVTLSEVISSAMRGGLTRDDADKAVEQMVRDGIIFTKETEKGPPF